MQIDPDDLRAIVKGHFAPAVLALLGPEAEPALEAVLVTLKTVYRMVEEDEVATIVVVVPVVPGAEVLADGCTELHVESDLRDHLAGFCIEVRGENLILHTHGGVDVTGLSDAAVVYLKVGDDESFFARGTEIRVQTLPQAGESVFGMPAFRDLRSALEHYRASVVRHARCTSLRGAWAEDARIFFWAGPEDNLQESLEAHLISTLRDAEIRREQNIDGSHPVDLKVYFTLQNRMALIEIKWLGKSRDAAGLKVNYSASRARDGAVQLRDYLVDNRAEAPGVVVRGFLVVIDGRRRGTHFGDAGISQANGLHFATAEIDYDAGVLALPELEMPLRMFCEPKWT